MPPNEGCSIQDLSVFQGLSARAFHRLLQCRKHLGKGAQQKSGKRTSQRHNLIFPLSILRSIGMCDMMTLPNKPHIPTTRGIVFTLVKTYSPTLLPLWVGKVCLATKELCVFRRVALLRAFLFFSGGQRYGKDRDSFLCRFSSYP